MNLQQKLETHIKDSKNPFKIYDLAKEYDRLENGAMAVSLYLKAADITEDKNLQYKSLIGIGLCYDRQRDRNHTSEGAFLDAAALLPERPEAHYHLCTIYEKMKSWKRCLLHANLGLATEHAATENEELLYPGTQDLEYYQALSKWSVTGQQDGKRLFFNLKYKQNLKPYLLEKVEKALGWIFYPDVIPYVESDLDRFKYKFDGIEDIKINHSKHFQDMFVLSAHKGKRNGFYLEIGSGGPFVHNNTALLETKFGWKGISIDINDGLCYAFRESDRKSVV